MPQRRSLPADMMGGEESQEMLAGSDLRALLEQLGIPPEELEAFQRMQQQNSTNASLAAPEMRRRALKPSVTVTEEFK